MKLSFPFNSVNHDRRYKAEHWAAYFASFIGTGIFPTPSTNLQVIANGDLTVTVKSGKAWIEGRFFSEDDIALTLDNPDGVLNRIDRVVVRCDYIERSIFITVKKGAYSQSPAPPVLQRDADAYELALADIIVGKGVVNIQQSHIEDLRLNSDLCGYSVGIIKQVDTTTLYNQIKDDLARFNAEEKAEFIAWFETLKDLLDENAAANLLNIINEVKESTYTKTETDTTRTYTLTHTKSGTAHTLAGLPTTNGIFQCQFKAVADYAEGDTFEGYTAKPSGEDSALPDKAFITGDLVSLVVDTESKQLGFKLGGGSANDTLPSLPVFSLTPRATSVIINFTELSSEDYPHLKDYVFVYKTGSFPQRFKDGKAIMLPKEQSGLERSFEVTNLVAKETYYFRVFTRNSKKQVQTMVIDAFQNIKIGYQEPYFIADRSTQYRAPTTVLANGAGIFGGMNTSHIPTNIAEFYDKNKAKSSLPSLSQGRYEASAATSDIGAGVFGGSADSGRANGADFYSHTNKSRVTLPNLPIPVVDLSVSPYLRGFIVSGGYAGSEGVNSVYFYDENNIRTSLPNMSYRRMQHFSANFLDGVGIFGGRMDGGSSNFLSSVEFYNENKVRSLLTSLSSARYGASAHAYLNGVGVWGGCEMGKRCNFVEFYDRNKIKSLLTSMLNLADSQAVAPFAGGVGVLGGACSDFSNSYWYDKNKVRKVIADHDREDSKSACSLGEGVICVSGNVQPIGSSYVGKVKYYPLECTLPKA